MGDPLDVGQVLDDEDHPLVLRVLINGDGGGDQLQRLVFDLSGEDPVAVDDGREVVLQVADEVADVGAYAHLGQDILGVLVRHGDRPPIVGRHDAGGDLFDHAGEFLVEIVGPVEQFHHRAGLGGDADRFPLHVHHYGLPDLAPLQPVGHFRQVAERLVLPQIYHLAQIVVLDGGIDAHLVQQAVEQVGAGEIADQLAGRIHHRHPVQFGGFQQFDRFAYAVARAHLNPRGAHDVTKLHGASP